MELVFVHGWGFDASFWDPLAILLSEYPQRRIDHGYFGKPCCELKSGQPAILIGHSLGFMHGLRQRQDWMGWVAINGFARFIDAPGKIGCVPFAVLREMRKRFAADPAQTLQNFYALIGARISQTATLNADLLRAGLDELRDEDIGGIVAALDVPGLVLAARYDPLVPVKASEALAGEAPHVQLRWQEAGDHLLPQSDPAWCATAIKGYINQSKSTKVMTR